MSIFSYSLVQRKPDRMIFKGETGKKGDSASPTPAPSGKCRITNMYVDPITEKLVIEYDDIPVT